MKGIFFFLAQTFFLAATIFEHQSVEDYHQRYLHTQSPQDYGEYRKCLSRRSDLLWMGSFCYAISAADAYVSAHFYGFEVDRRVRLVLFGFRF